MVWQQLKSVLCGWNNLINRQIVRVTDPADGVRVLHVAVGELCRTPAADWCANELLRADQEGKTDGHDHGVLAAQAVHIVVVYVKLQLPYTQYRFK